MSKIIGIDLGTSNSAASVMEAGKPVIIPSAEGASVGGKSISVLCGLYQRRSAFGWRAGPSPGRDESGRHGV